MAAQTAVDASPSGLTPLPLWTGILAGPLAWAGDLMASYAVVPWVCRTGRYAVLPAITAASLAIVVTGAVLSARALRRTAQDSPIDGELPWERVRFMALLGLASSALFALQVLAGAIPVWVLDACQ